MLKRFNFPSKPKSKSGLGANPPARVPGIDDDTAGSSGDDKEVHKFLDHAKYRSWSDVEGWLSASPRRPCRVNDAPDGRWPALHHAALSGSAAACALLLRYGADPTASNADGDTPADVAESRGIGVEQILRTAAEDWRAGRRETLFCLLSMNPISERSKYHNGAVLVALDADRGAAKVRYPFVRYGQPMYPLFPSVRIGASADVVLALCDAHPPALEERTQSENNGLLHEACRWGAPLDTLQLLLSKLPNATVSVNVFGQTPLHMACMYDLECGNHALSDAIRLVAEANPAALHLKDNKGRTPLAVLEDFGGSPKAAEILREVDKAATGSEFFAKLMEEDDRNINFKISELPSLIEDVHNARFFYTLVNSAYHSGGITSDDRAHYVIEGFRAAALTTTCTDSIAVFKLLLRKASDDGALPDLERAKLDREAEVTHTSHAPFVRELWEHVRSNAARIEGLECNVEALSGSIEKLKSGIRHQKRVEAAVGLVAVVLNAVSFGVAGTALSAATQATIGGIFDFGDVRHIGAVVRSVGDPSVKDAFELGLQCAEAASDERLYKAATDGNPVVTIAFAARLMDTDRISARKTKRQVNHTLDDIVPTEKSAPRLIDRIKFLEDQVLSEEFGASVSGRVSNLEIQVLGSKQEERGSLLRRVD